MARRPKPIDPIPQVKIERALWIKLSSIIAVVLLIAAVGAASFIGGYSIAFAKNQKLYADQVLLQQKAAELESEILHLKNYAVLIDAMTTQGQGAMALQDLPLNEQQTLDDFARLVAEYVKGDSTE